MKKQHYWLNRQDTAASLGISGSAFDRWGVAPVGRIANEKFFTLKDVVGNRLSYYNLRKQKEPIEEDELRFEQIRLTRENADAKAMDNEISRKEKLPAILLERALILHNLQVVSILQSIPGKIKKRIPHLTAKEMKILEREVKKIQNAASKSQLPMAELEELLK